MIRNSPRSLSVEFQRVCMYNSQPRLSTVISKLSKFNNRLKALKTFEGVQISVSIIIMDFVFGLFLILPYLFRVNNVMLDIREEEGMLRNVIFYCWFDLALLLQFQLCFIKSNHDKNFILSLFFLKRLIHFMLPCGWHHFLLLALYILVYLRLLSTLSIIFLNS